LRWEVELRVRDDVIGESETRKYVFWFGDTEGTRRILKKFSGQVLMSMLRQMRRKKKAKI